MRPYFGKHRKQLTQALVLGVGAAAFAALLMFTAGYLISGTAEARGSILLYYLPIAFVQLFGLTKPVLRYFERLRSHDWVFRMTSSLRVRLFKSLENRRMQQRESSGKILGTVAEDIGHIQNLYLRSMFPLIIAWITLVLAVVALGVFDWVFAGVALACLGLTAIAFPIVLASATQNDIHSCKRLKDGLYESLTDDMLGSADWVFAGRGSECRARNQAQAVQSHDAQDRVSHVERTSILAASSFLALFNCLALWWAAMQFGGTPGGDANWIAAFILGLFPLMESFSLLPTAAIRANEHRFAIEDLNEFPDVDDSIDIPETPTPSTASNDIEVSKLTYAYPGGQRCVLNGVSLAIPAGQRIAMLGPSGSGKSTFAALLRGELAPTSGTVELGGVPATEFGDVMAGFIGIVQQDPYLFNRTVRDNLLLARPEASDDDIWHVLEQVQLADLVRSLPRGLATMMDEAGMRFSGGERHRIALARVLLADTPIVLLDEPTIGLDAETEQGILDTLIATMQDKTLILITHHLQGIEAFDRVVFLENGRIEIDGSPTELTATNERYQQLLAFDGAATPPRK